MDQLKFCDGNIKFCEKMRQVDENIKSFQEFYKKHGDEFHQLFFQNYNDSRFITFRFTFDAKYYNHFHNFIKYYFENGGYEIKKKGYGKETITLELVCRSLNKTRYYEKFVVPVNEIEKTDGSNLRKQILLAFEEQNFNIEIIQPSIYWNLWFFSQGFKIQGNTICFLNPSTVL